MFNWINSKEISFNSFLLMDRWLIKMILDTHHVEFCAKMAIALTNNPVVAWYFVNRCPECEETVNQLLSKAPKELIGRQKEKLNQHKKSLRKLKTFHRELKKI